MSDLTIKGGVTIHSSGYTVTPAPLVRWVRRYEPISNSGGFSRTIRILQFGRLVAASNDPAHPIGSVVWEDVPEVEEGA